MIGLTKSLAREWAPLRINVNAVAPGFIETRLTAARAGGRRVRHPAEMLDAGRRADPDRPRRAARRRRRARRVALRPDSDYVTGQVVEIHGGLEIVRVG